MLMALSVAFRYRTTLIPHVPNSVKSFFPRFSHYTPLSTFHDQVDAGLTSSNFDVEANIRDGDSRAGLDEHGTQEVLEIMRQERVKRVPQLACASRRLNISRTYSFDQARLIRQNRILAANGIDPSGMCHFSPIHLHLCASLIYLLQACHWMRRL